MVRKDEINKRIVKVHRQNTASSTSASHRFAQQLLQKLKEATVFMHTLQSANEHFRSASSIGGKFMCW